VYAGSFFCAVEAWFKNIQIHHVNMTWYVILFCAYSPMDSTIIYDFADDLSQIDDTIKNIKIK
jgi:hypothetical protein